MVINVENDGKQDNYLDLADFERKGETAPTLIAERVQVFNNGFDTGPSENDSGVSTSGAIMQISDSSIWGNGWSGVWTAGWHGAAVNSTGTVRYHPNGRTVLDNVTIFDNLGNGVDSRGGQVTVTNSNVYDNKFQQYVNFIGLSDNDFGNASCIRTGGFVKVDSVLENDDELSDDRTGIDESTERVSCTSFGSEVRLGDPTIKPFPAFPSPFLP